MWNCCRSVLVASILASTFFVANLEAQTETGQITGTVVDPAGAVLVGTTIRVVSAARGITREVTSSGSGTFSITNLQSGTYQLTASKTNFATDQRAVDLGVGARVAVTISMQVGSTTTIVEVTDTSEINTSTQTMAERIPGSQILNLPTLTRNPYALISTVGNTTTADPAGADRGVGVAINGLRSSDVGILLDGVPNSNNFDTRVGIKTPLDSVGEVTVITNGFTAEYGRALAGVINVETRSGTNTIHGTVYEFNRVSALASNSFDNNANQLDKATFVRNQFGFSAGGAIVKDKLFVFGNPEWTRVRSQQIQTATIAMPNLIAASAPETQNFFNTYGKLKSNLNPLQTFTRGSVCTTGACTAIPADTPIYQKVAYGVPADSGGGDPQNTTQFAGKVDYNLTDKTQMYFRYARYYSDLFPGTVTNSPYVGYDSGESVYDNGYALSLTHLFSPTWVSQTKISYNRIGLLQPLSTAPIGPTLYTTLTNTNSLGNAPITYPGYSPFTPGNSIPFGGPQNYC